MVARLRGRPSPRPPGPEPEDQLNESASSRSRAPRGLVILTALSLLAAVAASGTLYYFTLGPGKTAPLSEAEMPVAETGPAMELGPFVVNLGNVNDRRYLRLALSLEFQTRDPQFVQARGTERSAWLQQLKTELHDLEPVFKDVVVTTLSSRQAEQLGTPNGKEVLKAELIGRFNRHLEGETRVQDVYFTDFVIQ
ncbi:MAG: flagellar basal body-associated FliL family protein [Candidatus Sericytochromatia bacterium]